MSWLREVFQVDRPIIGMVHLLPLPGTPLFPRGQDVSAHVAAALQDVEALQDGGIDAVMFCNENDRPYTLRAGDAVVASMGRIIGEVLHRVRVPYGVDVLWDPKAAIALAKATGARFVREVFTGAYDSDMGLWSPRAGEALRYRQEIDAQDVRLLFNINAEFATPLAPRSAAATAKSVAFSSIPDGLCVSGQMTGEEVSVPALAEVRQAVPAVPIFANTGVRTDNVVERLQYADGCIVGTSLKQDGITWNPIDPGRVRALMQAVSSARQNPKRG